MHNDISEIVWYADEWTPLDWWYILPLAHITDWTWSVEIKINFIGIHVDTIRWYNHIKHPGLEWYDNNEYYSGVAVNTVALFFAYS